MAGWRGRLFGKARAARAGQEDLSSDPRWQRLNAGNGWSCPCCGKTHAGPFDLAFAKPDPYPGPETCEPNGAVPDALAEGRDILTEDFCLSGPHRFLRCVLPMPIRGSDARFAFGVWGSINPDLFEKVLDHFDGDRAGETGPYFSWLSNRLPGASCDPARCTMTMQNDRQRPVLTLDDPDHPFYALQRDGITFDALLDLYAGQGHDIRPHLGQA